jgi:NAD(P)H-dependent FMN reductase
MTAAIAQSDGFVFVTPEYNYGPSAVLKNAMTGSTPSGIARRLAS